MFISFGASLEYFIQKGTQLYLSLAITNLGLSLLESGDPKGTIFSLFCSVLLMGFQFQLFLWLVTRIFCIALLYKPSISVPYKNFYLFSYFWCWVVGKLDYWSFGFHQYCVWHVVVGLRMIILSIVDQPPILRWLVAFFLLMARVTFPHFKKTFGQYYHEIRLILWWFVALPDGKDLYWNL